jgi:hypothetical protein
MKEADDCDWGQDNRLAILEEVEFEKSISGSLRNHATGSSYPGGYAALLEGYLWQPVLAA